MGSKAYNNAQLTPNMPCVSINQCFLYVAGLEVEDYRGGEPRPVRRGDRAGRPGDLQPARRVPQEGRQ